MLHAAPWQGMFRPSENGGSFFLQGCCSDKSSAVYLILGGLGLRAWWCFDARAAKFNLWLRPLVYLMVGVMSAIQNTKRMSYGMHPAWVVVLVWLRLVGILLYRSKVMWSYRVLLLRIRRTSGATQQAATVELSSAMPV
ncbi:unnamed protein product [Ectocarpus fasciculatus]